MLTHADLAKTVPACNDETLSRYDHESQTRVWVSSSDPFMDPKGPKPTGIDKD